MSSVFTYIHSYASFIKVLLLFFCVVFFSKRSHSQIIRTIAGNGTIGSGGNGGLAIDASFNGPSSLRMNKKGDIFIADIDNHLIRKIDHLTNIVTVVAGNGQQGFSGDGGLAIDASLNHPIDLDFDAAGNLYIADSDNNRIRKVNEQTGIIATVGGNGTPFLSDNIPAVLAGIPVPNAIAVDTSGNIFISEQQNHRIRMINKSTGTISTVVGNGGFGNSGDGGLAINANVGSPLGLRVNARGDIFFVDYEFSIVRKVIGRSGIITTLAGRNIAGYSGDGGLAVNAFLNSPTDVEIDTKGNLFVTDGFNHVIRRIDATTTIITTIAGTGNAGFSGDDGPPLCAQLNGPTEIITDSIGDLYLTDYLNQRIRKIIGNAGATGNPTIQIQASNNNSCPGSPVSFSASVTTKDPDASYQWYINGKKVGKLSSPFTTNSISDGDIIQAKLESKNGCSLKKQFNSDTLIMHVKPVPAIDLIPIDTSIYRGSSVLLHAMISSRVQSFRWAPTYGLTNYQSLQTIAKPDTSITYQFIAESLNGCTIEKKSRITIVRIFNMPTAFTPNNDRLNDVYRIPPDSDIKLLEFAVFNRWGNRVFQTTTIEHGWDGYVHGKEAPPGTYIYFIRATRDKLPLFFKGTLQLIR